MVLLASNNISNLCAAIFKFQINFCYVILIVGVLVWPFLMLKSPMSFWQAAIGAMITSIFAAIFIVLGAIHDAPTCTQVSFLIFYLPSQYLLSAMKNERNQGILRNQGEVATYPEYSLKNLFLAYGTIAYSFGGHGAFPTIQHDMVKPFRFNRSVWASYIFILFVYLAVSLAGYFVYGGSMRNTIIPSLQGDFNRRKGLQEDINHKPLC
ncbi:hypothetical protein ANCCAN_22055 [Ancylostoma caninum]|uniref:Amino acid transporter transmembrane domain-containing protein n=1 Tax=Ancylostoma caninum TaxID=29170 RepID=A0A368FIS7_ANCCA|nr:hypothetical protein ANCCAN_22055 [Ancylostoma caninum]